MSTEKAIEEAIFKKDKIKCFGKRLLYAPVNYPTIIPELLEAQLRIAHDDKGWRKLIPEGE